MTTKLTPKQNEALAQLTKYGSLTVGYQSPTIMRTFDSLVKKGLVYILSDHKGLYKEYRKI
jgi:DNA-binding MarR family transcriptional regulator